MILDLRLAGVESERARRDFHWQTPAGAGATRYRPERLEILHPRREA